MKLGARIVKTGIAITLAIYIATLLGFQSPAFAGIAATFAIQPSIYRTYQSILEQVQANIIGAITAFVFVLLLGNDPFVVGLAAIIVILINLRLKLETTIPLALVTVIAIMESPANDFTTFSLIRFSSIMIGVLSSFLVNLLFVPPKYETKLYNSIVEQTEKTMKWVRFCSKNASEFTVLKENIERLKESAIQLNNLYLLFKEERNYSKKTLQAKGRKLVLFRQMMLTSNYLLDILKKMHRNEVVINGLPKEFYKLIYEGLDNLLSYHEQILWKYNGKIRAHSSDKFLSEMSIINETLMSTFMNLYEQEGVIQ